MAKQKNKYEVIGELTRVGDPETGDPNNLALAEFNATLDYERRNYGFKGKIKVREVK